MIEFNSAESERLATDQKIVDNFNEKDARAVQESALAKSLSTKERNNELEAVKLTFEPLSSDNLEAAKQLCDAVFVLEKDAARKDLESSLIGSPRDAASSVSDKRYWVAKYPTGEIVGITGVYTISGDRPGHCWLGWFALKPELKGHKLGTQMLERTLTAAQEQGKTDLYIMASDHPDMAGNAKFYNQNGCPIVAVLNQSGNHVAQEGKELPQSIIRISRDHYSEFIDAGVTMFIRRRNLLQSE